MSSPRGFGKKYFTFASVLAHSTAPTLRSQRERAELLLLQKTPDKELEDEDPPLVVSALCILNAKTAYHSSLFETKMRLMLLINIFIPRCPYYTTYFAFRRTGVHPPATDLPF